jgi:hypothetical protein
MVEWGKGDVPGLSKGGMPFVVIIITISIILMWLIMCAYMAWLSSLFNVGLRLGGEPVL